MKILLMLVLVLSPLSMQAACKCNCNPADASICASSYDIDHPCGSICPAQTPGIAAMITACPVSEVTNPLTGVNEWIRNCPE